MLRAQEFDRVGGKFSTKGPVSRAPVEIAIPAGSPFTDLILARLTLNAVATQLEQGSWRHEPDEASDARGGNP